MRYNRCGHSGLLLPAISLGLWQNFGEQFSREASLSIICKALEEGITHIDLANNYGPPPGSAETRFGDIISGELGSWRDKLIISTKAGYHMWEGPYGEWGSRKHLMASINASLRRLRLDYVDIFYHHRPDPHTPLEESMGALADIVRQGKALYVGISNYSPEGTQRAAEILASMGTRCLIHQPSYSMLERKPEDGLLECVSRLGIGCIAYSPLAQGRLSARYLKGIPEGSRVTHSVFLKENHLDAKMIQRAASLNEIALKRGQTLAQMALAWVLRMPMVTSALIGASSPDQIQENTRCLEAPNFSREELDAIELILSDSTK
jgi:L-glyceraldehyde 3-phosphate reductase